MSRANDHPPDGNAPLLMDELALGTRMVLTCLRLHGSSLTHDRLTGLQMTCVSWILSGHRRRMEVLDALTELTHEWLVSPSHRFVLHGTLEPRLSPDEQWIAHALGSRHFDESLLPSWIRQSVPAARCAGLLMALYELTSVSLTGRADNLHQGAATERFLLHVARMWGLAGEYDVDGNAAIKNLCIALAVPGVAPLLIGLLNASSANTPHGLQLHCFCNSARTSHEDQLVDILGAIAQREKGAAFKLARDCMPLRDAEGVFSETTLFRAALAEVGLIPSRKRSSRKVDAVGIFTGDTGGTGSLGKEVSRVTH